MRAAFKEWAVITDALGRGEQILILRKGGISEGPGGFQACHPSFFLFPTLFHQQRESVLPAAQTRFDELASHFPPANVLRLEFFADVAAAIKLNSLADAQALRGQHIWRDEVISERFDWGRDKSIFALAVRVFRLPQPVEIPMSSEYGGCKSWIELEADIPVDRSRPALSEAVFVSKLKQLNKALGQAVVTH